MCTASVTHLLMENPMIQQMMSDANLDLRQRQVVMTLYSMDAAGTLDDHRAMLPVYLGLQWEDCREILSAIEGAGLITRDGAERLTITHPIADGESSQSCGCS